MGRRRATRRSSMQRLKRVSHDYKKGLEGFKDGLASRDDIEKMLIVYHEQYVAPLVDFLNWRLAHWYERLWWWMQDTWRSVVNRNDKEEA